MPYNLKESGAPSPGPTAFSAAFSSGGGRVGITSADEDTLGVPEFFASVFMA